MIYGNGSEFKLHCCVLCKAYVKRKLTSIENPQANAILESIHAVFTNMLCTAELDTAELVYASDIDIFLADSAWAICSTHHTKLKASAIGLLAPSQRCSVIKEEEACRLWPEKKELLGKVKVGVVVLSKRILWELKRVYKWSIMERAIRSCSVLWQLQDYDLKIRSWLSLLY